VCACIALSGVRRQAPHAPPWSCAWFADLFSKSSSSFNDDGLQLTQLYYPISSSVPITYAHKLPSIYNHSTMKTSSATLLLTATTVSGFAVIPHQSSSIKSSTALNGLFDGVKDAFSAPALERSKIDSERETPIDRWMGWSVVTENMEQESGTKVSAGTLLYTK
jgi:hypothetical protein